MAIPFITEFVFRSPQTVDGTQKEVADLLITHGKNSVLASQKCQEKPASRDAAKTTAWARKKAKEALSQLRGALRTASGKPIWCDHPRRGRVEFPEGLPPIDHALVLVEVFDTVDLEPEAAELPLAYNGTPIAYLSVNDFLNLAIQLRTTPELFEYLEARRALPERDQRVIGCERSLFEFYLLNGGTLQGCGSREQAAELATAQSERLRQTLAVKAESDRYNRLLEHVADQLATRNPHYADNLQPSMIARFDTPGERRGYLEMQGVLADLRLDERAKLGRAFYDAITKLGGQPEGFVYMAAHLDSKPDWVFVFGSSKKVHRPEVLERASALARGAMASYGKKNCLFVMDRDGEGYEVGIARMGSAPTPEERKFGEHMFGRLRMTSAAISLVPKGAATS